MSFLNLDNYFSITDILVTEERILCEFQLTLPKLGFLYTASKTPDLQQGTKLSLPLWLANFLYKNREPMVTFDIPKIYKDSYKEILQADACAVELTKWNQYYYELGLSLPQTSIEESSKIAEFLHEAFKARFRIIMDFEQNTFAMSNMRKQLTVLESKLLSQGTNGRLQLQNWLNRGVKNIKTSAVLTNLRKRKRLDI